MQKYIFSLGQWVLQLQNPRSTCGGGHWCRNSEHRSTAETRLPAVDNGSAPPHPFPCRNIFSALDNGSCNSRTPVPPAAVDIGAATPNTVPPPKLVYRQWTMGLHLLTRSHAEIYFQPWTMGPATPEPPFHLRRWTLVPQLRTPFHRRNSFTGSGQWVCTSSPVPMQKYIFSLGQWVLQLQNPRSTCGGGHWCRNSEHRSTAETRLPAVDNGSAPPHPFPCRNIFSALDNGSCNSRTPVPPAAVDIGAATPNTVPPPKLVYRQWTWICTS